MEPLESPSNIITLPVQAAEVLTKGRFISAIGELCENAARAIGVSRDDYAIGEPVAVITSGVTGVEAGGAFSAGDELQSDSTGRAVVYSSGKVNGIALTASTGAGKMIAVKVLTLLIAVLSFFAPSTVSAQGNYELTAEVKSAALHVAGLNRYVLKSIVATKADSLTIVAKVSDSVQTDVQFLSTAPDGTYLDNTIIIPSLTATNAAKYTSATISVGARHNIATLAISAKSTRSTTASSTADGVKVWVYYHVKR